MSDESIAGGSSSDDLSVAGGDGEVVVERLPQVRRTTVRQQLRPYILVGSGGAEAPAGVARDAAGGNADPSGRVIGAVLAMIVASGTDGKATCAGQATLRTMALRHVRVAHTTIGFLDYEAEEFIRLKNPISLQGELVSAADVLAQIADEEGELGSYLDRGFTPRCDTVGNTMDTWAKRKEVVHPVALAVVNASVAGRTIEGSSKFFHCVAITSKLNRKRLLVANDPSKKRLRTMTAGLKAQPKSDQGALRELHWNGPQGVKDPAAMLHWMESSQTLRDQNMAAITCKRYAKLISARSGIPVEEMLKDMEFVSGRLLVKSRVRLDCAAMLLHRRWWREQCRTGHVVSIHILCDSSPQWRGGWSCSHALLISSLQVSW